MTNKSQQNGMYDPIQVSTTNVPPKRKRQSEDVSMIVKDIKGTKVPSTVLFMSAYTTKEKEDNCYCFQSNRKSSQDTNEIRFWINARLGASPKPNQKSTKPKSTR
ncbi:hypothetical protein BVRB_9g225060 [Beta vulgaris subsp. vulgaris]|uniref:Uncharacterized protein n=1 Tax=Beta vulgaris subsp. vulgaris TaxID=3555 RepID=A0A0J8B9B9_BETVV|nr:hypothetical protein BVRB_9g225060 [Beta vulgaris subsp. vulgaris]